MLIETLPPSARPPSLHKTGALTQGVSAEEGKEGGGGGCGGGLGG